MVNVPCSSWSAPYLEHFLYMTHHQQSTAPVTPTVSPCDDMFGAGKPELVNAPMTAPVPKIQEISSTPNTNTSKQPTIDLETKRGGVIHLQKLYTESEAALTPVSVEEKKNKRVSGRRKLLLPAPSAVATAEVNPSFSDLSLEGVVKSLNQLNADAGSIRNPHKSK